LREAALRIEALLGATANVEWAGTARRYGICKPGPQARRRVARQVTRRAVGNVAPMTERRPDFELLETILLEDGSYFLRERHLERLAASAKYFGITLSLEEVLAALDEHGKAYPRGLRRARLLVSGAGRARVESRSLDTLPARLLPVALAQTPVSRRDLFLYHKTTKRDAYDSRRDECLNVFDFLLWNEDGELTEFTTGNLVVESSDGHRWTPPVESGLLAGTFRAELIARGEVRERVLTRLELKQASRCWLINSVRRWVRVSFVRA